MAVNIDFLKRAYFCLDEPVPYHLKEAVLNINPIKLRDSEIFLSSVDILTIDKNSISDVKIIQMSYLEFICTQLFKGDNQEIARCRFYNILNLCLGFKDPIFFQDKNGKFYLKDSSNPKFLISAKQFDEIKRIILFQNLPNYDDSYINPEVKKAMDELDEFKRKNLIPPTLERKIAIITAHSGIPKKEQLEMTLRSHSILFDEVVNEVEYMVTKPFALYSGQADKIGNWIYKENKNKIDDYFISANTFNRKMGGNGNIKTNIV